MTVLFAILPDSPQMVENRANPRSQLSGWSSYFDVFARMAAKCQTLSLKYIECCVPSINKVEKIEIADKNYIDTIPNDILKIILQFLPKEDQYQVPQICSKWRKIFFATPELKSSIYYVNLLNHYKELQFSNPNYKAYFPIPVDTMNQYRREENGKFFFEVPLEYVRIIEGNIPRVQTKRDQVSACESFTKRYKKTLNINLHPINDQSSISQSIKCDLSPSKKEKECQLISKTEFIFRVYTIGRHHVHQVTGHDLWGYPDFEEFMYCDELHELKLEVIVNQTLSSLDQRVIQQAINHINSCLANQKPNAKKSVYMRSVVF